MIDEIRAADPGFEVLVVDDGSTDGDRRRRPRARRARRPASRSTSGSAAPSRPATATRASTASTSPSRWTATASTTRRPRRDHRARRSPARPTSSSARASPAAGAYRAPLARRLGIRALRPARSRRSPARRSPTRPPASAPRTPRDRTSSPTTTRTTTSRSRRRSWSCKERPPPRRGPRRHARARRGPLVHHGRAISVYYSPRCSSRSSSGYFRAPRRSGGRVTRPRLVVAALVSLALLVVVFELIRSRRLRERYALLWLLTAGVMLVLSLWRTGLDTIAGARRDPLRAVGALRGRRRLHASSCSCTTRPSSRASRTRTRRSRSGSRC